MPGAVGPDERHAVAAVQRQVDAREDAVDGHVAQRGDEPAAVAVSLSSATLNAAGSRGARSHFSEAISRSQPALAHLGLLRHLGRVAASCAAWRRPCRWPGARRTAPGGRSWRCRPPAAGGACPAPRSPARAAPAAARAPRCRPCSRPRRRSGPPGRARGCGPRSRRGSRGRARRSAASRCRPASQSASQARPSASRWLVGSSSSSTVGSPSRTDASRQRAASPPRDPAQQRAAVEVLDAQPPARLVQPRLQRPAAERLEALLRLAVGVEVGQVGLVRVELEPHLPHLAQRRAQEVVDRRASGRARPAAGSRRGRPRRARPHRARGRSRPASRRISVVLPTPLAPTRPARAPSSSVKEMPSNSGAPSWDWVRSVPLSMWSSLSGGTGHAGCGRAGKQVAREQRHATARPARWAG